MPFSRTFISKNVTDEADRLDAADQLEDGLARVRAPWMLEQATRGLREIAYGSPDKKAWTPLPIVVSERPDARRTMAPEQGPGGTPITVPEGPPETPATPTFRAEDFTNEGGQTTYSPQNAQAAAPGSPSSQSSAPVPAAGGVRPPAAPSGTPAAMPSARGGAGSAYQLARANGLDDEGARIIASVAETEGGAGGALGDQGQSHGVLQFHERGELPGFAAWLGVPIEQARQMAQDPALAVRYATQGYLGAALAEGRRQGLSGAELATFVQRTGQRSEAPETTGANYERLYGAGAQPDVSVTGEAHSEGDGHDHSERYEVKFGFNQAYGASTFNSAIPRHRGVDLQVRGAKDGGRGEPVPAFRGGTVAAITSDPNGGQGVILQDEDGLYHRYFHFDSIGVKQGQRVAPGESLGVLGASGTEGFPHVHFEVARGINGDPMDSIIDPTPYMRPAPRRRAEQTPGTATQPLAMSSGDEVMFRAPLTSPDAAGTASAAPPAPGTGPSPGAGGSPDDLMMMRAPLGAEGGGPGFQPSPVDPASIGAPEDHPDYQIPTYAPPDGRNPNIGYWPDSNQNPAPNRGAPGPYDPSTPVPLKPPRPYVPPPRAPWWAPDTTEDDRYMQRAPLDPNPEASGGLAEASGGLADPFAPGDGGYSPQYPELQGGSAAVGAPRPDGGVAVEVEPLGPAVPPTMPGQLEPMPNRFDQSPVPTGRITSTPGEPDYARTAAPTVTGQAIQAVGRGVERTGREMDDPGLAQVGANIGANWMRSLAGRGPVPLEDRAFLQAPDWLPAPVKNALTTAAQVGYTTITGAGASNIAGALWEEFGLPMIHVGGMEINPGEFIVPDKIGMGGMRAGSRAFSRAAGDVTDAAARRAVVGPTLPQAQTATQRALGQDAVEYGTGIAGAIERGTPAMLAGGAAALGLGAATGAIEDPQDALTWGASGIAAGLGARRAAASPAVRAGARSLGEEGARQLMDLTPMPRIVPPSMVDQLDIPVRIPEDPRAIRAIEAIGGTVDPEKGVTFNVTRAQGAAAAGGHATRGSVFYEAVRPGERSDRFVRPDNPNAVGGSQVIGPAETRFRSPIIVSEPPASGPGFDDAMRQMGASSDAGYAIRNARTGGITPLRFTSQEEAEQYLSGLLPVVRNNLTIERVADGADAITARMVDRAVDSARRAGPENSPKRAAALKEVVTRFGGDPDLIDPLLAIRGADASESGWAIRENILAAHARRNGYDGVVTVQAREPNQNELFNHPKVAEVRAVQAAIGDEFGAIQNQLLDIRQSLVERGVSPEDVKNHPEYRPLADKAVELSTEYNRLVADVYEATQQARREMSNPKITELADVRESHNPTPGAPNPRVAEAEARLEEAINAVKAARSSADNGDPVVERAFAELEAAQAARKAAQAEGEFIGPPGYTLRSDIPRRPDAGGAAARSLVPFDPASAAAGGALGAATGEEEDADPMRTAGGAAVAGLLGSRQLRRVGARWQRATAKAAAQAAAARAAGTAPPPTAGDWLRSISYSGMIGPATGVVNAFGNGLELVYAVPKEITRSLARGAPREAVQEARGLIAGFMRAGGEVLDAMAGAHPGGGTVSHVPLSQRATNPFSTFAAQLIEAPTRFFSEVPDAFYRSIATSMGESRMAAQIATNEGLTGGAWSRRVNDLLAEVQNHKGGQLTLFPQQVDDIVTDGEKLAERLTLRGDIGPRGQRFKDGMDSLPAGLGHILMPFFNTPYQMLQRQMERSPAGLKMGTQPTKFDRHYDAVVGTTVAAGVGAMAFGGLLTGSGPDDPQKRRQLQSQGWQSNSTLIGGVWIPNNVFGVFGPMLDSAGELGDAYRYQKKGAESRDIGIDLAKRAFAVASNQVYLRGIADIVKAAGDPAATGESWAAQTLSRGIPLGATARLAGNMTDPNDRAVDKGKDVGSVEAIRQRIARGLPGQGLPVIGGRAGLDVAQDVLGRPVENERRGLASLGPRSRTPKPDAAIQAFTDAGVDISDPPGDLSVGQGVQIELTPREQRIWQRERGKLIEQFAPRFTSAPWWQNPEARENGMRALQTDANKAANDRLLAQIGAAEIQRRAREAVEKKRRAS